MPLDVWSHCVGSDTHVQRDSTRNSLHRRSRDGGNRASEGRLGRTKGSGDVASNRHTCRRFLSLSSRRTMSTSDDSRRWWVQRGIVAMCVRPQCQRKARVPSWSNGRFGRALSAEHVRDCCVLLRNR